ncbi:MAG: hypothetical protein MZV49_01075 [Rhodopseudomonas palustris]|nr:hypothetical protein [Rhodopseudomonas palustris]
MLRRVLNERRPKSFSQSTDAIVETLSFINPDSLSGICGVDRTDINQAVEMLLSG